MTVQVLITDDAVHDLEEIYRYIAQHDSVARAGHVFKRIEQAIHSLAMFPDRGNYPRELLALGIREYREIFFKPYRIIYRARDGKVYIYLITDGRRSLQTLLVERLLGY